MKNKEWTNEELEKFELDDCRVCGSKPRWFHSMSGDFRIYCRKCFDEYLLVMTKASRNPADVVKAWNKEV